VLRSREVLVSAEIGAVLGVLVPCHRGCALRCRILAGFGGWFRRGFRLWWVMSVAHHLTILTRAVLVLSSQRAPRPRSKANSPPP